MLPHIRLILLLSASALLVCHTQAFPPTPRFWVGGRLYTDLSLFSTTNRSACTFVFCSETLTLSVCGSSGCSIFFCSRILLLCVCDNVVQTKIRVAFRNCSLFRTCSLIKKKESIVRNEFCFFNFEHLCVGCDRRFIFFGYCVRSSFFGWCAIENVEKQLLPNHSFWDDLQWRTQRNTR